MDIQTLGGAFAKLLRDDRADAAVHWFTLALSNPIERVDMFDGDVDTLRITFSDGSQLSLQDNGQSCCESRYMTCDDDLTTYQGALLRSVDLCASVDSTEADWGEVHETQWLKIETTKGAITCVNHNEHNGYYGGFSLKATWESPDGTTWNSVGY